MSLTPEGRPGDDLRTEALRVFERAQAAGITVRITGGVAIGMRCPSAGSAPLARPYADLDLVGYARERQNVRELLTGAGYRPDEAFNALHGSRRLYFWDPVNGRQLDVFLDQVEMCHIIDLRARLGLPGPTLSLADLLLMKLQIVETNQKDLQDIVALLVDCEFGSDDETVINLAYLSNLAAGDWGLWRTMTMVASRADEYARQLPGFLHHELVSEQVRRFTTALDQAPKSRGWKLRAKVGDRKKWYQLPEAAQ